MFIRYCFVSLLTVWFLGLFVLPSWDFWLSTSVLVVVFASFADEAGINITLPVSVVLAKTKLDMAASLAFHTGLLGPMDALSLMRHSKRTERSLLEKELDFPVVNLLIDYKRGKIINLFTHAYLLGRTYRGAV